MVAAHIPKPDSSYSLSSNISSSSIVNLCATTLPRLNASEDQFDRQEVLNVTVDVQNFVAAYTRLKKAMEDVHVEMDLGNFFAQSIYYIKFNLRCMSACTLRTSGSP